MKDPDTGKKMFGWYKGMGPWFYSKGGVPVSLPLNIEPNKPQMFVVEVGVRVPQFAWNAVSENLSVGKKYKYDEAERIFSERGYPQFGQYQLNDIQQYDDLRAQAYGAGPYEQNFTLYLTKGDGVQVSAKFLPSISDAFIQGENSGTSWERLSINND